MSLRRPLLPPRRRAEDGGADLAGHSRESGLCTARLVVECLVKAESAIWQIAEFHAAWRDSVLDLVVETQALRSASEQATPDRVHVRRPGFDESGID